jgi:hypothetical protein
VREGDGINASLVLKFMNLCLWRKVVHREFVIITTRCR